VSPVRCPEDCRDRGPRGHTICTIDREPEDCPVALRAALAPPPEPAEEPKRVDAFDYGYDNNHYANPAEEPAAEPQRWGLWCLDRNRWSQRSDGTGAQSYRSEAAAREVLARLFFPSRYEPRPLPPRGEP